jgi:hypothetical protein
MNMTTEFEKLTKLDTNIDEKRAKAPDGMLMSVVVLIQWQW